MTLKHILPFCFFIVYLLFNEKKRKSFLILTLCLPFSLQEVQLIVLCLQTKIANVTEISSSVFLELKKIYVYFIFFFLFCFVCELSVKVFDTNTVRQKTDALFFFFLERVRVIVGSYLHPLK
jgi:hypothetical protein